MRRRSHTADTGRDARNIGGQVYALTVVTAVVPGHEDLLSAHIAQLGAGPRSPLAKLATTHFARLVIISALVHQGGRQRRDELRNQYLLFAADFDGSLTRYLDDICGAMAPEADAIWGHCIGYPGTTDRAAFERYFRHNQLETKFPFAPYGDRTVGEVRAALGLRERLTAFAVRTQAMAPQQLHDAYRQEFAQ